jgi:alkanesulfonate monooxygenase SsuD/methylene tetrahydromethanopterin reductase-like flavin-dependent oxidoreductase (luciferase family)
MKIGFGLPNAIPDIPGGQFIVDLARQAERLGFSSVATIGRVAYPSHEELVTLAAVAGATERIGLFTDVLLGPTREPALLAKQAATLDQVSGGRFVLGAGVGIREDDFSVTGADFKTRGRRWDAALELMHRAWRGEPVEGSQRPISPRPVNGEAVPMMFGGRAEQTVARTVRYGIGYTQGGGGARPLGEMKERVERAWREAGRAGRPEFRALAYFAIGEETHERAARNLADYYGGYGERLWAAAVKDAAAAKERVLEFEAVGCDELIFFAEAPGPEQLDRLAEAVL